MNKCISKFSFESNDASGDDYFESFIVTLSEALLHFMLTICTLPSERRITPQNNLALYSCAKFTKIEYKTRAITHYSVYKRRSRIE